MEDPQRELLYDSHEVCDLLISYYTNIYSLARREMHETLQDT